MTILLIKLKARPFYYVTILLLSYFKLLAEGTNGIPAWFVLPRLVWGEATNGVRAGITDGDPGSKGILVFVAQTGTNWGWRYVAPPNVKFSNVELRGTNGGIIVPSKMKKLDGDLPQRIPLNDLPRFPERGTKERGSGGGFRDWLGANPATLQEFFIQDAYRIEKEGDYILTVCPVIYEYVTDRPFVSRLDLPCVTTKIHLKSSE